MTIKERFFAVLMAKLMTKINNYNAIYDVINNNSQRLKDLESIESNIQSLNKQFGSNNKKLLIITVIAVIFAVLWFNGIIAGSFIFIDYQINRAAVLGVAAILLNVFFAIKSLVMLRKISHEQVKFQKQFDNDIELLSNKILEAMKNTPKKLSDVELFDSLLKAIENKNLKKVVSILRSNPECAKMKDSDNKTLLHYIVSLGADNCIYINFCDAILKAGADINAQNNEGDTVLHLALKQNGYEFIVYLIEKGADLAIKNNAGQTPRDIIREKINHLDKDCYTMLYYAVCWSRRKACNILKDLGADKNDECVKIALQVNQEFRILMNKKDSSTSENAIYTERLQ